MCGEGREDAGDSSTDEGQEGDEGGEGMEMAGGRERETPGLLRKGVGGRIRRESRFSRGVCLATKTSAPLEAG